MNLALFMPETVLGLLSLVFLGFTLAKPSPKALQASAVWGAAAVLCVSAWALGTSGELFSSTYRVDALSQGFKLVLAAALFVTVIVSRFSGFLPEKHLPETYFFLSSATLGMMMLMSALDILTLYVSLELSSYSLYLLSVLRKRGRAEAGVKYLIFGAAASGVMLWGFALLAGLAQTTSLAAIAIQAPQLASQPLFSIGLFFVSAGFLFKLSAFPMHFWAPDVYESASTPVTLFIATASKAAAIAILVRILLIAGVSDLAASVLGALAFVSMTLGNTVALAQRDVKRLLAYSSIAQAGYVLLGLLSGSLDGFASAVFYAVAYALMNAAVFLVVAALAKADGDDNPQITHFDGLAERSPFLALLLLLGLLSLAGIPPLAGFTGKWILFTAPMEKGHWFLVLWAVLNSVVSLFYYLTLVKHAYLEKPRIPSKITLPMSWTLLGFFLLFSLLGLGLFPNGLITFAQGMISGALLR